MTKSRAWSVPGTVTEGFARQVALRPAATAVSQGGRRLSYAELDGAAARLADRLRDRGVGPETVVGVCAERSVERVVAVVAVLRTGGAYLALEPGDPPDRTRGLFAGAGARVLLAPPPVADRLSIREPSALWPDGAPAPVGTPTPPVRVHPDNLAYVSYTSGSTGTPKGVCVPHRAVTRLVHGDGYAGFGPDDAYLQLSPLGFDASTFEIWAPLLTGGRVAVFPPGPVSLEALAEVLAAERITTLWLTSGLFHRLVDGALPALATVRQLLAGGDVMSVAHVDRVVERYPDLRVVDMYGPTENTTFSCFHPVSGPVRSGTVPIGRPVPGTTAYVLDRELRPVARGVAGELYVGGTGVARGYLGRPGATAERFVPDPFSPGDRLYRTGDLARRNDSGDLEFLGRVDDQLKIDGFRVEPAEVAAVLVQLPGVQDAVVVARDRTGRGERRLVGYVVLAGGTAGQVAVLRRALRDRLPAHLVPSALIPLEELPLTANGKVDRAALPPPGRSPARPTGSTWRRARRSRACSATCGPTS